MKGRKVVSPLPRLGLRATDSGMLWLAKATGRSRKSPGKVIEWWRGLVGMNGSQEELGHIRTPSHC